MSHWILGFCQRLVSKATVGVRVMVDADPAELITRRAEA